MNKVILPILILLITIACDSPTKRLATSSLVLEIDNTGRIKAMEGFSEDFLYPGKEIYLISVMQDTTSYSPERMAQDGNLLTFEFLQGKVKVVVQAAEKERYLTFRITEIQGEEHVDVLVWGPYANTLGEEIGETVGVVRDDQYAMGLQALNPKTLGGYPWNANDAMPQIDIFESGDYSDLSEEGKRHVLYRVEAAKPEAYGSTLQAYVRSRKKDRVVPNLNHDHYLSPAFNDGGIRGSGIALFGCHPDDILDHIEAIELGEDLPHPRIDGEWGKRARSASAAYLIMDFGEEDIDRALAVTRKAGLRYLYHPGPFRTWGHFEWNDKFPDGNESMRRCVEMAEEQDIMLGVHTLSNFITTNDPYVTPVPDPRLGIVGFSVLKQNMSTDDKQMIVEDGMYFDQFRNNNLRTVRIGEELIQYGAVDSSRILDLQRGAFNSTAFSHEAGDTVYKLADHGYKVFLTNPELSVEVAERLADMYNTTGLRQISFDGLEGNRSTGMGNYGEILFTNTWYENLNPDIRKHYIADASRTSHFFWHMYTRMNWGEPWYAGFRESQQEYRLKNQAYFKRNLMPAMLGWFLMRPNTSIEDIEWLLARSAAFDAGYAFVTNYEALDQNGNTNRILELIGTWEKLRMNNAFSDEQKKQMQDISREFTLQDTRQESWLWREISVTRAEHVQKVRQPGEPLYTTFSVENPHEDQPVWFIITAPESSAIENITIEIDNYRTVSLEIEIPAGHYLKYEGADAMVLYDPNWNVVSRRAVDLNRFKLASGSHTLNFNCDFKAGKEQIVKMEWKTLSPGELIFQ